MDTLVRPNVAAQAQGQISDLPPSQSIGIREPGSRPGVDTAGNSYRADFPTFSPEANNPRVGVPFAYLDSAATTQRPVQVLKAIEQHYVTENANPYRGMYRTSVLATDAYEGARAFVAAFVGADASELVFVRNATEALNMVATCYALANVGPDDEIVLPVSEHHSNLVPWQRVCQRTGAKMRYMRLDAGGRLTEDELDAAIGPRTKIVAVAHVSNVLGTRFPVKSIVERAHAVGAKVVLDCAQSAGHLPLDFHAFDVDFAAFSGHKMYGPMGIGALYVRAELLEAMDPFLLGGEMVDEVWDRRTTFQPGPRRFEAGTPNVGGAVGMAAAAAYLQEVGFGAVQELEHRLTKRLLDGLRGMDSVRIYGNPEFAADRAGIVSFNIGSVDPQDVGLFLDAHNVAIRTGSHCAQPLHRRLGTEQSCRASLGIYNTEEDVDQLLAGLTDMRHAVSRRIMGMFP